MATKTHLNGEILKEVGRSSEKRYGLVTANAIAKFCAAIDEDNPLYTDPEAARAAGHADVISPPLFNGSVTRPVPHRSGLLGDGQYDNAAPPGLTHLQTMLAGQNWEIVRRSVAGERVIEQFTTKSITERQGATGPIVFVEKEATITSADEGDVVERYGTTLILREPPPPLPAFSGEDASPAPREQDPATSFTDTGMIKRPDMITLFMFSATIWAVHRIHWDVPYARSEGLPGPVLPGWMLSSYLAQLAETKAPKGGRLHRIAVRYRAPVHPDDVLDCRAVPDASGLTLAMTNQHGKEVTTGTASFAAA
jgi:3-methylfumaryl-CoA hydratase